MNLYPISLCSAAWKTLDALLELDCHWCLSGRVALWWLTAETGPIKHLGVVWHRRNRLGDLEEAVPALLKRANLEASRLHRDPRRLWLIVKDTETEWYTLRLTAEPAPPLAPARRFRLNDRFVDVESWRDILQRTLSSLNARPNPDDLVDLFLLLRRDPSSLDQGLLDALRRDPSFDPERLALSLAPLRLDKADLPPGVSLEEFSRFQQNLAIRILAWARSL